MAVRIACLLVAVTSLGALAVAQQMTIPEAVERMRPGPYVAAGRIRELHVKPFEEAVNEADLIVHASLRKVNTYLSDDQTQLYTDHEVLPIAHIAGSPPRRQSTPGLTEPVVLREWGGETTINGVAVKIYEEGVPALPTGVPLLLILSFNQSIGKYEVLGTISGAFQVLSDGRLHHLAGAQVPKHEGVEGAQLRDVVSAVRALRDGNSRD